MFVQSAAIEPAALLGRFSDRAGGAGAIVSFTGIVRGAHGDIAIHRLWLDHHERLTADAIAAIAGETRRRFALTDLAIVHRVGALFPGEAVVFVAAAAAHRRAAFDAVDHVMDRLKTDVPIWKRETRADGEHWIEAREADHADRARWEKAHG